MSHVMCHIKKKLYKGLKLVGGGAVINVATPSSFPCKVLASYTSAFFYIRTGKTLDKFLHTPKICFVLVLLEATFALPNDSLIHFLSFKCYYGWEWENL